MTREEQISQINKTMRWISYKVFHKCSRQFKFVKAYDKLRGRVFLDHDFKIPKGEGRETMFSGLTDSEIAKVLESAVTLSKMYAHVVVE